MKLPSFRLSATSEELKQLDMAEMRKHQARVLATLARTPILSRTPTVSGNPLDPNKYVVAGEALYNELNNAVIKKQLRLESNALERGCKVFGKLAMRGMDAYEQYGQRTGRALSVQELQSTMIESYDPAVTTFSALPNKHSGHLEYMFGLRDVAPSFETVPFVIESDATSTNGLRLVPSPYSMLEAKRDPNWPGDSYSPDQRCPASGIMLKKAWAAMIATCVENEHLYHADIARANAQQTDSSRVGQID